MHWWVLQRVQWFCGLDKERNKQLNLKTNIQVGENGSGLVFQLPAKGSEWI